MRTVRNRSNLIADALENVDATPALLTLTLACLLPQIILKREKDDLAADNLDDGLDGNLLVLLAADGQAILSAARGVACLQDVGLLVADAFEDAELTLDEDAGALGRCASVEVGVRVNSGDIDDSTDGAREVGPQVNVESVGGGDGGLAALASGGRPLT